MSRQWEPKKSTVELRPSRIRRDPVRTEKSLTLINLQARSRAWEIGIAIIGMMLFAVGLNALSFVGSAYYVWLLPVLVPPPKEAAHPWADRRPAL